MTKIDVTMPPSGAAIELYISPDCPYCVQTMAHYDRTGVTYRTYDAQNDRAIRAKMFSYTSADPTVPAIVIDGTYVQSGWGSPPRG